MNLDALPRSRIWVAIAVAAIGVAAAVLVVSSSRSSSPSNEPASVDDTMLAGLRENPTAGYSVKSVECVHGTGNEYACVADFYVEATGRDATVSYAATCDDERCVWRPG